jgi:hypothetical protein
MEEKKRKVWELESSSHASKQRPKRIAGLNCRGEMTVDDHVQVLHRLRISWH